MLLILPMLREQTLIAPTVDHFTALAQSWGPAATLVLTTTEREHHDRQVAAARLGELAAALQRRRTVAFLSRRFADVLPTALLRQLADASGDQAADYRSRVESAFQELPSTPELAAKLAAASAGRARHHHHPDPSAVMVHQINHAVDAELRRLAAEGVAPETVWIGVYNADSRPHPQTLTALAAAPPAARVVQQSALHTLTLGAGRGLGGVVCDGAALLQSRWSLAREIPRLRAQAAQARRGPTRWPRLGHCTGHGLFVRGDLWHEVNGLPTATMNEDLAFGYQLSAAGEPIHVLPLLEVADSPTTTNALVRQHRQWFFSYPQYPAAARLAAAAERGDSRTRAWLAVQGLARGALWLGQSPAIAATLLLPAVARHRRVAAVTATAAVTAYLLAPTALLTRSGEPGAPRRCGPREAAGILGASLIFSAGPWRCLHDLARAAVDGHQLVHDKTER
ncbi:glycosyltransferase [Micromonospora sp. DT227]|uniref:glycosyltransferase n=1 Tax=Micromonospora sp. DT227 TaxID=3393433 RepID=UPI003CEDE93D